PWRLPSAGRREHLISCARILVPATIGLEVHRAELPLLERIVDPRFEALILFLLVDLEPQLDEDHARIDEPALKDRRALQELLDVALFSVAHHALNPGAIVPTAVEDHDFACRWKMLDIALH